MLDILKKIFVSSLLLFSTNAFAQADLLSPEGMTPVMPGVDDGTAHVQLEHGFPYMGGVFTDAWMSSNGFLLFYDPVSQFGNPDTWNQGCCSGYNPSGQGRFSYMLAPLWTDLRDPDGNGDAGYYYKTDKGHSSFLWYNVLEYGTSNTNTFQVELYSGGSFDFIYDEVDITQHNVWIGFTGDTLKTDSTGKYVEINELMFAQGGMDEFDIEFHSQTMPGGRAWYGDDAGYGTIDAGPDCSNPLNDTSCEGYEEAYYDQQCSSDALYDAGCPGYAEAYYNQQCDADPLYDSGCIGYAEALFDYNCTLDPQSDMLCPAYVDQDMFAVESTADDSSNFDTFDNQATGFEEPYVQEIQEFTHVEDDMYTNEENLLMYEEPVDEVYMTDELVANDGSVNEEQILQEAIEVNEEFEEDLVVLEDIDVIDVLEDDILEEETNLERVELIPTTENTVATAKVDTISLVLAQTAELVSNLREESAKNGTLNTENTSKAQKSAGNRQNMAQESAENEQISQNGQELNSDVSQTGNYMSTEQILFGSDNVGFAMMTGSSSNDAENVSKNEQNEQNVQDMKQNLALGDSAPIGFAIIPVQTANGIIETVVPVEEQTLAERLAEQTRQQNLENSNDAAVGQTAALARLATTVSMEQYYGNISYSQNMYTQEQVYRNVVMQDNQQSHYNMFSNNYGKMRELIRSQY